VVRKLLTGSLIAALMAGTASADTLREALVSAYNTNPTLTGQRENLKATDTTVDIAKAAGRPRVSADVGLNRSLSQSGLFKVGVLGEEFSATAQLSVPLYSGGAGGSPW
jgi:outer membrane protein